MAAGALATMLVLLGGSHQQHDSGVMATWFRANYARESARVEQVYSRLGIEMREVELTGCRAGTIRHLHYVGGGNRFRVDTLDVATGRFKSTFIATPDENLIVRRGEADRAHLVRAIEDVSLDRMTELMRIGVPLAFAPYCWVEYRICDLFTKENVRIREVSFDDDPDYGRVCDVQWHFVDAGRDGRFGRLRFAMEHSWVLLQTTFQLDATYRLGATFSYGEEAIDGVPIITVADYWSEQHGERKPLRQITRESFAPVTPTPDLFDPFVYKVAARLTAAVDTSHDWAGTITPFVLGSVLVGLCVPWSLRRFGWSRQEHETVSPT
ncbi:hypothetical protein Mal4_33960 [Maioricimonas rarisocia]|uniref:Uncharacterized protein n=1 Tax=Maioricimonas rarisocia TaxID=2528026 RepID=A0A517Z9D9_9PLAN|nr:hypothetical protein [Maioricimonas rarisocia]QDU39061.1 hypothetical protein Mal4_33960 [Maioricimonas rarisocia]